jgi:hypothetical protein
MLEHALCLVFALASAYAGYRLGRWVESCKR